MISGSRLFKQRHKFACNGSAGTIRFKGHPTSRVFNRENRAETGDIRLFDAEAAPFEGVEEGVLSLAAPSGFSDNDDTEVLSLRLLGF